MDRRFHAGDGRAEVRGVVAHAIDGHVPGGRVELELVVAVGPAHGDGRQAVVVVIRIGSRHAPGDVGDLLGGAEAGLEDEVLERPTPQALARIFETKRVLIEMRRVLANTRDVSAHLQRTDSPFIGRDLWPFLRDVYDHVARNLDMVEMQRDLLTGADHPTGVPAHGALVLREAH